ncbi:RelA/SpoT family protein [Paraglaciecola Antarctic GD virus 1]|nr:RelA/SpoT family protein [Paraglaciecola Antarctic GD virus 1]
MRELALQLVAKEFDGVVDKAGAPYIDHLLAVAGKFDDELRYTVGLLHDLLEDTAYTADQLALLFPVEVVAAVVAMTKVDGEEYWAYIARVKADPVARDVKLADIAHNKDLTRLAVVTAVDLKRVAKYDKAVAELTR